MKDEAARLGIRAYGFFHSCSLSLAVLLASDIYVPALSIGSTGAAIECHIATNKAQTPGRMRPMMFDWQGKSEYPVSIFRYVSTPSTQHFSTETHWGHFSKSHLARVSKLLARPSFVHDLVIRTGECRRHRPH